MGRSEIYLRPKPFRIMEGHPDIWVDGSLYADNIGSREFTAANNEAFLLPTVPNPGTSDFFLTFWLYTTATDGAIFCTGATLGGRDGFAVVVTGSYLLLLFNDSVQAARLSVNISTGAINTGGWKHVVINFDRDGFAVAWINGVQQIVLADISTHSASLGTFYPTAGVATYASSGYLSCRLARIGYGQGAILNDGDIAELYWNGLGRLASELSAALAAKFTYWWDAREASGNLISQIGSNNGTDTNTVTAANGPAIDTPVNNLGVSRWISRDAAGVQFTQDTIAYRPLYLTADKSLSFDGTDDILKMASALLSGSAGRVMALVQTDSNSAEQVVYSQSDKDAAAVFCQLGMSSGNKIHYKCNNGGTADEIIGDTALSTGWHVLEWVSSGTAISMLVDGAGQTLVEVGGSNAGNWFADLTNDDTSAIGGVVLSGGASGFLNGSVRQIVALEPDASPTKVRETRKKLAKMAGITLA